MDLVNFCILDYFDFLFLVVFLEFFLGRVAFFLALKVRFGFLLVTLSSDELSEDSSDELSEDSEELEELEAEGEEKSKSS